MSWSISEILKPFKKLAVAYYQVFKLEANSCSLNSTTQTLLILIADGAPGNPKGEK